MEDTTIYKVVVNHEEQYSIWPAEKENCPWLERWRQERFQDGMPGLYQGSVDRHEAAQPEKENGAAGKLDQLIEKDNWSRLKN